MTHATHEPRGLIRHLLFLGKEMLFPRTCGTCHQEGSFLCESCFATLRQRQRHSQTCGHCGTRETPEGQLCFSCTGSVAHDGIFAALRYDDPRVAHLIHLFKYQFVRDLGLPLGTLLSLAILQSELPLPDAIIPVPLHPRRERWRGWNQADVLAETIVQNLPKDIAPPILKHVLTRIRFTTPQMSLSDKTLRTKNIDGAFDVSANNKRVHKKLREPENTLNAEETGIAGKSFWIIDDVAASGATIAACAQTLKEHGAQRVFGIVIAR